LAWAAVPWYEVEVIVFERTRPGEHPEVWPRDRGGPALHDAVELQAPVASAEPRPFHSLTEREYQLAGAAQALRSAGGYRVLAHLGWRQPGFAERQSRAVRIEAGPTLTLPGFQETGTDLRSAHQLEGTVRLIRSRFLHLDADIMLHRPAGGADGAESFRLTERRRMRSGELHYLDHPTLGMLVRVTPYERPGAAPAEEDEDALDLEEEDESGLDS
jgi:hypothetical protein